MESETTRFNKKNRKNKPVEHVLACPLGLVACRLNLFHIVLRLNLVKGSLISRHTSVFVEHTSRKRKHLNMGYSPSRSVRSRSKDCHRSRHHDERRPDGDRKRDSSKDMDRRRDSESDRRRGGSRDRRRDAVKDVRDRKDRRDSRKRSLERKSRRDDDRRRKDGKSERKHKRKRRDETSAERRERKAEKKKRKEQKKAEKLAKKAEQDAAIEDINLDSDEEDVEARRIEEARKRRQKLMEELSKKENEVQNDDKSSQKSLKEAGEQISSDSSSDSSSSSEDEADRLIDEARDVLKAGYRNDDSPARSETSDDRTAASSPSYCNERVTDSPSDFLNDLNEKHINVKVKIHDANGDSLEGSRNEHLEKLIQQQQERVSAEEERKRVEHEKQQEAKKADTFDMFAEEAPIEVGYNRILKFMREF
ncbi:unnamed protein product [Bursaphelenchus okinawaensis]|uniref:Uncharacterized protein n=1 Tax=Bursaphelenchus okinawaensis TaxID=465554 RepID=A0A811LCA1_9BILA|nr:unnamed protein product [Bursaphelenchus okinawaensis]CAG9121294.1 unnamed protein product [Bursaphelenchus okinawaensis]